MRIFSTRKGKILTAAACGVALGIGGLAASYWTGGGAGSGTSGMAAQAAALTVTQTAVTGLMPGGSKALSGLITNPAANTVGVKVGEVKAGVITVDKGLAGDYSVTGTAVVNAVVPKNGSIAWSGLTLNMMDTAVNQDASKNAVVTVQYTAAAFVEPAAGPQLGTVTYTNKVLVIQNVGLWPTGTGNLTVLPGDQIVVANVDWAGNHGDRVATTAGADAQFNFNSGGGFYVIDAQPLTLLRGVTRYPYSPAMLIG